MEFFDKLGKKASEAYKITADKTGKIAKETKIKLKISQLRTEINDLYEEIGKKVYEGHIREEKQAKEEIKENMEELCTKIDVLSDEIEDLLGQCLELRDKKQCKNCYVEMDKEYKYCPNCGAKQEENNEEESNQNEDFPEKDEDDEEEDSKEYKDNEEEKIEEQEENDNLENLEKTVKVESNVEENIENEENNEEQDENNEDNENNNDDNINMY